MPYDKGDTIPSRRLSAESVSERFALTVAVGGVMTPLANDPSGQPGMGGTAEQSCVTWNLVSKTKGP